MTILMSKKSKEKGTQIGFCLENQNGTNMRFELVCLANATLHLTFLPLFFFLSAPVFKSLLVTINSKCLLRSNICQTCSYHPLSFISFLKKKCFALDLSERVFHIEDKVSKAEQSPIHPFYIC